MLASAGQTSCGATTHLPDRFLAVDGARLRYRDEGHGPAVLLLHGWTLDLDMWAPQVAALRGSFRLVRLDRRGFGLSSGRASLMSDVSDIESIGRHLRLDHISLIGMSQGARAALQFAANAAIRVACIVLDGPPEMDQDMGAEDDVPIAYYRELVRTQGIRAFRREWALNPLVQLRTANSGSHELLDAMLERYSGADLLDAPDRFGRSPESVPLASIVTPVLVLSGEHDLPARLNAAIRLAETLPHAERAVIPDAGHLPSLDNPDTYNRLTSAFIAHHVAAAS